MVKIAAKEGEKRPLPGSYSEMFPNRFLKADMLKGAKVTLTIKSIEGEGLASPDDDGKKDGKKGPVLEWIVSFEERPLQFVMNKTNATCLYRMFGGDPHTWVGHRVTFFPTTVMAFGERQDCIRVFGSPDIPEDMPITVPQGRKKPWETVMRKTAGKAQTNGTAPATEHPKPPASTIDPRVTAGFEILGWTQAERAQFIVDRVGKSQADLLAELNQLIESRDEQEA